ncbi:hypothetical protein V8G54_003766 [Vigna mungo]|uniref:Uncharacterized protein n=1 Tax=Vigna mungo TaxID=3915 RepID=A0AAQ3PE24_VIGMU
MFRISLVKCTRCEESDVTEGKMNSETWTDGEEGPVHEAMFATAESLGQAEALNMAEIGLIGQTEALKKTVWRDVMKEEADPVERKEIWKLADIPAGKKINIEGNTVKEARGVISELRLGEHRSIMFFELLGLGRTARANWHPPLKGLASASTACHRSVIHRSVALRRSLSRIS